MPFRMLRHKAFMQAARIAFSIGGIYDEDEARDVIDAPQIQATVMPSTRAAAAQQRLRGSSTAAPQLPAGTQTVAPEAPAPAEPEQPQEPPQPGPDDEEAARLQEAFGQGNEAAEKNVIAAAKDKGIAVSVARKALLLAVPNDQAADMTPTKWVAIYQAVVSGRFDWTTGQIIEAGTESQQAEQAPEESPEPVRPTRRAK